MAAGPYHLEFTVAAIRKKRWDTRISKSLLWLVACIFLADDDAHCESHMVECVSWRRRFNH